MVLALKSEMTFCNPSRSSAMLSVANLFAPENKTTSSLLFASGSECPLLSTTGIPEFITKIVRIFYKISKKASREFKQLVHANF